MSQRLQYEVAVAGTDGAVQNINYVRDAQRGAANAADTGGNRIRDANRRAGQSFNDLKQGAETTVRVLDRTVQSVIALDRQYGILDSDSRRVVAGIGELTGRLQEQGLAAGAVTTTIEMMTAAWESAGWIERREQTRAAAQSMEDFNAAAGRAMQAMEAQARRTGTLEGATQSLIAAQLRHAENARQLAELQERQSRGAQNLQVNINLATRQFARQTEEVRRLTEALDSLQNEELEQRMLQDDIAARAAIQDRAREAAQRALQEARRRDADEAQFFAEAEAARDEASQRRFQERMTTLQQGYDVQQRLRDLELERQQAHNDKLVEGQQAVRAKLGAERDRLRQEAEAAMAAAQQSFDSISASISGTFTNAIGGAVDAWLSGAKSFEEAAADMVKGILKALVSESIVQAIVETARGIAALASYRYDAAALHFAAAGTWAAVGALAGGIGAATGAFGGGGGAGAGASAGGGGRAQPATSATPAQDPGGGVTVNLYAPNAIWTEQERAALIAGSLREGRRQQGRGFVRV